MALEPFQEHANANKPFLKTFFATPPLRNGPLWQGANPVNAGSGMLNCGSPLHSALAFILPRAPWSQGVGCWGTTYCTGWAGRQRLAVCPCDLMKRWGLRGWSTASMAAAAGFHPCPAILSVHIQNTEYPSLNQCLVQHLCTAINTAER